MFTILTQSLPLLGQGFSFHTYYPPEVYGEHPQNWVAEKDTNGFIHFGNGDGLLTYNGVDWNIMHIGETGRSQSLFRDNSGQMYVNGHSDFGMIVPDSLNQITFQSLSGFFDDSNGYQPYIWETYKLNGLIYYRHIRGIAVFDPQQQTFEDYTIPQNEKFQVSFRTGDSIIVDTPDGFWTFYNNEYSRIENTDLYAEKRLYFTVSIDEKSYLLGSTYDQGVDKQLVNSLDIFDGEKILPFPTEADEYLNENWVFSGLKVNDNLYALATIYGGVVFINKKGELLKIFNERTGLHSNGVYNMYLDEENILWLTLSEGIQKLDLNENILDFPEIAGIKGTITHIAVNGEDVLLKTQDGLYKNRMLKPENVDHFEKLDFDKNVTGLVTWKGKIHLYGSDGIYVLTARDNLLQITQTPVTIVVESDKNEPVLTFLSANKKIILNSSSVKEETIVLGRNPDKAVRFNNELYVTLGSENVYKFEDNEIDLISIQIDTTRSIIINRLGVINDKLFIGAEGSGENSGLYDFYPSEKMFKKSEFLKDHPDFNQKQIFNFQQCTESEVWFVANKELMRVAEEAGEWKVQKSPYQLAGKNTTYAMACSSNGLWVGGTKKLTFISDSTWDYHVDFKTNITGIFAGHDSLIYGGYGEPQQDIIFPYKNNELRFTYAAASFIDPERNKYQVKLEGFDNNWSEWNRETQKDYTNIPEGNYTFKVRSKNVYEVAGMMDSIEFSILPPWYRTWWAYFLYTLTITFLLYIAYIIRVNQVLKVYRIRNNIASNLHDEVSATLSSISYFAQAIKSDSIKGDKNRFVSLIADSAGDAKEKISDIVWAINPEHDDWNTFLSKCRRFASDLLESKDMKYSLKIVENIPGKLDMRLRQHLWLIYKEMVTNAVRHSGAGQLDVIIDYKNRKFELVVQDDGNGMDVDKVKKGNGLVNIHKRADEIKGTISLTSNPGFGTRWMLKVSL